MRTVYVHLQLNAVKVGRKAAKRRERNRGFASAQVRIISDLREFSSMDVFPLRDAMCKVWSCIPSNAKEMKSSALGMRAPVLFPDYGYSSKINWIRLARRHPQVSDELPACLSPSPAALNICHSNTALVNLKPLPPLLSLFISYSLPPPPMHD